MGPVEPVRGRMFPGLSRHRSSPTRGWAGSSGAWYRVSFNGSVISHPLSGGYSTSTNRAH